MKTATRKWKKKKKKKKKLKKEEEKNVPNKPYGFCGR